MVQATPFLLVLFLALGAHGLSVKKCSLTGRWVNDLGSNMTIMTMKSNGDFAGIYYTAVSATTKKIERSPLLGSQHQPYLLKQPTFGFTVHWTFSDSITVFTGQCFVDEDGKEVLKTMWLLRSHADKPIDDWKATLVGYNEFKRLESPMEPGW
ncbi:avidin-like isoform X2 [Cyanistes caeruleus]|uniref:Avidin n=1 Tax=Cyanistes caeruleus TaxID=156563 RepID=A0A8C0Z907_CYACU|nr:avidin-like isoform X2 [Cyanistes caeruleus]